MKRFVPNQQAKCPSCRAVTMMVATKDTRTGAEYTYGVTCLHCGAKFPALPRFIK